MKGNIKFDRKNTEIEVERFRVDAVKIIPNGNFEYFKRHLLADYDFIEEFSEKQYTDSSNLRHCLLILPEIGDDGVLVDSEGYSYARYSAYYPNAKTILQTEIQKVTDAIIKGGFGETENGSWIIGFDEIKEHFDLTVTRENGIGELLIKELEAQDKIGEVVATEDCLEITEYLEKAPKNINPIDKLKDVLSLVGSNIDEPDNEESEEIEPHVRYRELSVEEVKVAIAKHTLWLNSDTEGEQADFRGCLLKEMDLSNCELNNAVFDDALLLDCNFKDSDLSFSSFEDCRVVHCNMRGTTADECNFKNAILERSNLSKSSFSHANFADARIEACKMFDSTFKNSCFENTDFSYTALGVCDIDPENTMTEDEYKTLFNELEM